MRKVISGWLDTISQKMSGADRTEASIPTSDVVLKVQAQMEVFQDRVMRLRRLIYLGSIIVGGAFAAGLGLFAIASSMSLPDTLIAIDFPSSVVSAYEGKFAHAQVSSGRGVHSPGGIDGIGGHITDMMVGFLPKAVGLGMIGISLFIFFLRQSAASLVTGIGGGLAIMSMSSVVLSIFPSDDMGGDKVAPAMIRSIESLNFSELKTVLQGLQGIGKAEQDYVLAQVAVRDAVLGGESYLAGAVDDLRSAKPWVTPEHQEIAYVLQVKHDGQVLTDGSKAFVEDFNARVSFFQTASYVLLVPSLLGVLALLGFALLTMYLQARAGRVDQMIKELGWKEGGKAEPVTD